jgi:hypothetical protein
MTVGPLPTLAGGIAGHGVADGNVHRGVNLVPQRCWPRIASATLGSGSLQEWLSVECKCDAVQMPVEQFSSDFGFGHLEWAVTADCVTLRPAVAAETLPVSAVAMKW